MPGSARRITFADQAQEAIVNAAAARALIAPHLGSDVSVDPSLASLTALSTELCQLVLQSLPFESRARMARATAVDPAGPDSDQSVHDQIVAIVAEALERKLRAQDEMAARALRDAQQEASFATPARPAPAGDASATAPLTPGLLAAATARLSPAQVASVSSCLGGSVALAFEHLIGRTYFACTRNRDRVEQWLKKQRTDCTIVRLGTQPVSGDSGSETHCAPGETVCSVSIPAPHFLLLLFVACVVSSSGHSVFVFRDLADRAAHSPAIRSGDRILQSAGQSQQRRPAHRTNRRARPIHALVRQHSRPHCQWTTRLRVPAAVDPSADEAYADGAGSGDG